MAERIQDNTTKVRKIGNSKGFIGKSSFLEMAGMDEKGTEVEEAVYYGKHGIFLVYHLPGEQPGLQQAQEKVEEVNQK